MSAQVPQGRPFAGRTGDLEAVADGGTERHLNPRCRIEAVFTRIAATRMAGAPVCNPALEVEMVGVRRWQDEWLGALITPWAINLMLLPGGGRRFRALWPGDTQWWQFPAGAYEFLGNREPGLGAYQVHSLFSPARDFVSQDLARTAARSALEALFEPAGSASLASTSAQPGRGGEQ